MKRFKLVDDSNKNIVKINKDDIFTGWLPDPSVRSEGDFKGIALYLPDPLKGYSYKVGREDNDVVILVQSKD